MPLGAQLESTCAVAQAVDRRYRPMSSKLWQLILETVGCLAIYSPRLPARLVTAKVEGGLVCALNAYPYLLMSRAPRALLLRILPVLEPRLSAASCAFAQRVDLAGAAALRSHGTAACSPVMYLCDAFNLR